jgi:bifunctional ADP-heptose synthase (sugar kinase/adenylyltransferase)
MLESLKYVDEVVLFDSREDLINSIKDYSPDIMIVGDDYKGQEVYGSEYAEELIFFGKLPEYSTTKILKYYENLSNR